MEKIIARSQTLSLLAIFLQIFQHFQENDLWHPNHHGFKSNHSTTTAITQLYDCWLQAAEYKDFSAALLLCLSAAFDVVPLLLKQEFTTKFAAVSGIISKFQGPQGKIGHFWVLGDA